ncbi:hypothetical protein McanCB56680_002318 [Microsporum canis]
MSKTPTKPWLLEARSSEAFIVLVVSIAIFVDVFLYSMIVPIIPKALVNRIGVSPDDAQTWMSVLLATYGGTLLIGSPIFGYVADRTKSPKGPFIAGLFALALSTALFMLARSPVLFVIARGLQGLSGAAVWVAGLALVVDTVAEDRVGEAMGYTTMGMSVGSLLGPAAGGVLYDKLGFYGAFYVPIALIVLDIILRLVMIEPNASRQWKEEGSDEHSPLLQPPESVAADGTSDPKKAFQLFHLLGQRRLLVALLAGLVGALTFSAFETTLPLFLIESFHWSSSSIGLVFLIMAIPGMGGALVGKVVDRYGPRISGTVAFIVGGATLVPLRFVQHPIMAEYALMISLLGINGLAISASSLAAMSEVFEVVYSPQPSASGGVNPVAQGYALFNMAFAGGQLLGPILGGVLKESAGWKTMTLVIALVTGATGIITALYAGDQPPEDQIFGPDEVTPV